MLHLRKLLLKCFLVNLGTALTSNKENSEALVVTSGFGCENSKQERAEIGLKENHWNTSFSFKHKGDLVSNIL